MGGSTKLMSSGAGGVILTTPGSIAADVTVNLPTQNSTLAINGPAFSAYQSSAQTPSANTFVKVQFQTEEFDTASCFDNVTNYRFTPNVAGYYQINLTVTSSGNNCALCAIYKNGVDFKHSGQVNGTYATYGSVASALIYFNGTTDYVEGYIYLTSSTTLAASNTSNFFQGALVRAA